jgi:hypothetical protein
MIFRNTQTQEYRKIYLARTLYMIFGGIYFLFLFRPRAFIKYTLMDMFTFNLHRFVTVLYLQQILEKELHGAWVMEDSGTFIDWLYPYGQFLLLAMILGNGALKLSGVFT